MPATTRPLLNMMEFAYRIRNWPDHFETSESRKIKGALTWVAIPTKHDGRGYKRVARASHGVQALAGWWSLLQVAAKMPVHGLLADRDGPLDAADIADKTNLPAKIYATAFNLMCDEKIGWLEQVPWNQNLDFAGNIRQLIADQRLPADTSWRQQTPADTSGKQRPPKKRHSPADASDSQQTPADPSGSQRTPAESSRDQRPPAAASVQDRTGQDSTDKPPAVPQGGQASESGEPLIQSAAVAKRLICEKILGGRNPARLWSPDAENRLATMCEDEGGIPMQEVLDIAEYRAFPHRDDIPELRGRSKTLTETTLMTYWGDEATRAAEFLKKYGRGRNGSAQKKDPPGWRQFFRWKYDDRFVLPASFADLELDQRREWEREHAEFDASPAAAAMRTLDGDESERLEETAV